MGVFGKKSSFKPEDYDKAAPLSMVIECVVPSCKNKSTDPKEWIGVAASQNWKGRTHLGWCPTCARRFQVREPSLAEVEERDRRRREGM